MRSQEIMLKMFLPGLAHSRIFESVWSNLNSEPVGHTDVIFQCQNGTVAAHKIVLASASKFALNLLTESSDERATEIFVPDYTILTIKQFLKLVYTGSVFVPSKEDLKNLVTFGKNQLVYSCDVEITVPPGLQIMQSTIQRKGTNMAQKSSKPETKLNVVKHSSTTDQSNAREKGNSVTNKTFVNNIRVKEESVDNPVCEIDLTASDFSCRLTVPMPIASPIQGTKSIHITSTAKQHSGNSFPKFEPTFKRKCDSPNKRLSKKTKIEREVGNERRNNNEKVKLKNSVSWPIHTTVYKDVEVLLSQQKMYLQPGVARISGQSKNLSKPKTQISETPARTQQKYLPKKCSSQPKTLERLKFEVKNVLQSAQDETVQKPGKKRFLTQAKPSQAKPWVAKKKKPKYPILKKLTHKFKCPECKRSFTSPKIAINVSKIFIFSFHKIYSQFVT